MDQLIEIINIVTALIASCSAIAALTPTPKDDSMLAKAYKIVDLLAINVGKAKECAIRFKAIEERLERGSQRMDRMEMSIWGVYPFILASVFLAKYL